jgi:CcmD family protein
VKNFESIFAAYSAFWLIFVVYLALLAARQARLKQEIERLKQELSGK